MASSQAQPPEHLTWEPPPPSKSAAHKGSKWDPVAKQLRANPGRWACLGRDIPTGIVSTIRNGELKCFKPKGAFEAVTRNHSERWQADVFARYVGENQEYA
jgi:hypothetical protein